MNPTDCPVQFITNRFGDEVIYEANRDSFGQIGAQALYQRQYGDLFSRENTLFVIIGTDSGLLPRWIGTQEPAPGSRYLFIELPGLIRAVRERYPDICQGEVSTLVTPDQWQALRDDFRFSEYAYLENIRVVLSVGAQDAFLSEYRGVQRDVTAFVEEFNRAIQLQLGNYVFIQRQIENIADDQVPAACLMGSFSGRTAVLLGGGPSLDDALPWIRQHRAALTVIAVSRIARQLLAVDLQPDIVVSIDPHPVSFDVSKEGLLFDADTLLVNAYHVSPPLLSQWPGPAVYRGDRYPWATESNGDNLPLVGPTVTNMALAMAVDMGFERIVLAGVDLCFSREGHTHASGSNERAAGPRLGNVGNQVLTNGGWMADTDPPFAQAVEIMGGQAERALAQGCEIVNPAPGAAQIPHVSHMPLAEITPTAVTGNSRDLIHRCLPELDAGYREAMLKEAAQELAWAHNQLRGVQKLAGEALSHNERLFGHGGGDADFKYKKRMDKVERRLDGEYRKITPLVKSCGAPGFLRLLRPNRDEAWSDEELERWGQRYYQVYKDSAGFLLGLVEAAQRRISTRLEELKPAPDLAALLQGWREEDVPGRARLFAARHPALIEQSDAETRQAIEGLIAEFDRRVAERDTRQAQSVQRSHSLGSVRSKLLLLFQRGEQTELAQLADTLTSLEGQEAIELQALARGYLAELAEQPEEALQYYNHILEGAADSLESEEGHAHNPRLEDALRRMSYITLQRQDTDNALRVLDVLSALSPAYEPQYAELLRLSGRLQDAVDVYTDYLEKAPTDLATMLKLGKLFQEAGAVDSARWAYDYILEQSPDNQAARQLRQSLEAMQAPS